MSKTKNSSITSFFTSTSHPPKQNQNQIIIIEDELDHHHHHHQSNSIISSSSSSSGSKLNSTLSKSKPDHQISKTEPISKRKSNQQVSNPPSISIEEDENENDDHQNQFISITKPTQKIKSDSKKSNSNFLSFSELDAIRKSKQSKSNLIPIEPNWPKDDFIHNRDPYRSHSSHLQLQFPNHPLQLKKGKSKTKTLSNEEFIFNQIKELKPMPSIKLPSLKRLDLLPPSQLLSDLKSNLMYQKPLMFRLLQLLEPLPHQTTITFDHPSLLRQHHRPSHSSSLLWTQKYAPKTSFEVLGEQNLKNVKILKAWLKEIALKEADLPDPSVSHSQSKTSHGKKSKRSSIHQHQNAPRKRTITRKVERKSKRRRLNDDDDLKDFIVNSDEEDSDTIYAKDVKFEEEEDSEEDISLKKSPRKRIGSEQRTNSKIEFENLTNLMLLTGPSGTGKTCSVYALANEIGWDVFELNSGVLRNRKEIERLVGDVARNHVLPNSSNHQVPSSTPSIRTTQTKVKNPKGTLGNVFSEMMKGEKVKKDLIHETQSKFTQENRSVQEEIKTRSNGTTKQTLILLEEVDIVYQQDKEFWPGVIQLISESMRPVIMTCNDKSILPLDSLPLQACLEFKSPSIEEGTSLMKVISLNEGHLMDDETLKHFSFEHRYKKPIEMGIGEEEEEDGLDLRRCLNMLQFWCQWGIGCKMGGVSWLDLEIDKESKMLFSSDSLPIERHEQDLIEMSVEERIYQIEQKEEESSEEIFDGFSGFEKVLKSLEIRSFVDGFVDQRQEVQIQNFEWDLNVCETDEIVLPNKMKWIERDELNEIWSRASLASDDQERKNAIEIRKKLIGILNRFDERKFELQRKRYCDLIESSTDFLPLSAPLNSTEGLILDHLPWLRLIVKTEDEAEESYEKEFEKEGRVKKRNDEGIGKRMSRRLNAGYLPYPRKLSLDEVYLDGIRRSGIGFELE
ncbi:hypothetical protein DFH28DRAFT_1091291 [Melampsora americana]|nr:hypothetical protein DFH28DRAFT_1091291 [Melampsora americana]